MNIIKYCSKCLYSVIHCDVCDLIYEYEIKKRYEIMCRIQQELTKFYEKKYDCRTFAPQALFDEMYAAFDNQNLDIAMEIEFEIRSQSVENCIRKWGPAYGTCLNEVKIKAIKHNHRYLFKNQIHEELIATALHPCRMQAKIDKLTSATSFDMEAFFECV